MRTTLALLSAAALAAAFAPAPLSRPACSAAAPSRGAEVRLASKASVKRAWTTTGAKKLSDTVGGASDQGAEAVGLIGSIPVEFKQNNKTLSTMAIVGQPLSEVASQAGQFIKYKCKKGECGTCEVKIDGKWVRSCVAKVPSVDAGAKYEVTVRDSMVETKKSSRFFSIKSFFSGAKNNILGMVGFVKTGFGRGEADNFKVRLSREEEIARIAAAKKAARLAKEGKK